MSLSNAFNIISSSFQANAAQTAVISGNISNANTTGYSRKTANLAANSYGGVDVVSVTRAADSALLDQANAATSEAASQQALSAGLATLAQTVSDSSSASSSSGATQNGDSPSAMLSNLQSALATYEASPSNTADGEAVVTAARQLAQSLNTGSTTVQQVRSQADSGMASAVSTINSLLTQFGQANDAIVSGLQSGADVTNDEDTRDNILTQLSQQIGISTVTSANGSMSIYTDSGVTLFHAGTASTVSFQPTATYSPGTTGNAVYIDGVAVTGSSSTMPIQTGALAGYATLRDSTAVTYQDQLDQIANGLISATAETVTSGSTTTTEPGVFTYAGSTGAMPTSTTGLAGTIEVNSIVTNNPEALRDGVNEDFNTAANTTTDVGYSATLENLLTNLRHPQTFSASAGLSTDSTLSDYATQSVSWLEAQRQSNSSESTYQSTLLTSTTSAFSNATGVSLDNEMSQMLDLENSYSASAQLMTTINSMFTSLVSAVTTINGNAG